MSVAILDLRPAAAQGTGSSVNDGAEFVRRLGLDALPASRRRLACRWQRDRRGRLVCRWEAETALASDRAVATAVR